MGVLPVFLTAAAALAIATGMLVVGVLFGPHRAGAVKRMPYESGMDPIHDTRRRFDVRFHLVAIAFLIFDVELLFIYPWAVASRHPSGVDAGRAEGLGFGPRFGFRRRHVLSVSRRGRLGLRVAKRGLAMAIEQQLPDNVMVSRLDELASWCRKNSLWPMPFATACCGIELMATGASRHDLARFGAEVFRFSPRQCDLMIVAGRVVMKMLPVLQRIWQQMHEPKWCISMGACASTGGVFDTYCVVQGIDRFIPVDMYIPGCPPRPEQLIQAIIDLQDKIQREGTLTGDGVHDPSSVSSRSELWWSCRLSVSRPSLRRTCAISHALFVA